MNRLRLNLFWIILCAAPLVLLTSCKDDKQPEVPQTPILEALNGTFTNRPYPQNVLQLNYAGSPLADKDVHFSTRDLQTGTVVLEGVFPGVERLAFTVNMAESIVGVGERYSLTVPNESFTTPEGITVTLGECTIERGLLVLNFDQVVYPVNKFSYNANQTGWWNTPWESILYLRWVCTPGTYMQPNGEELTIEPGEVNPGALGILSMIMGMIPEMLRDIQFMPDGNIRAHYKAGETWMLSPNNNLCHYFYKDEKLYIKPNLAEILATVGTNPTGRGDGDTPAIDMEFIVNLYNKLSQWLTYGIPFNVREDPAGFVSLYLDGQQLDFVLTLLQVLLPQYKDQIIEMLPGLLPEHMQGMAGMITALVDGLLDQIMLFIPITEEFELGINMAPTVAPAI